MADEIPGGRFVWYDLMTTDPGAAIDFYSKTLGWGTDQWKGGGEDMPPYTMFTVNGAPIGGVMKLPEEAQQQGARPHWLGYISSTSVDQTLAQAATLGATVMVPGTDIPTVGRFGVMMDPQGSVVACFTPAAAMPGHEGMANPGEVSWHELLTSDREGAFGFYSTLFGWEKLDAMDMGPAGIYQLFGRGGAPMGGIMTITPDMPAPPSWLFYVRVDDAGAASGRVTANGGAVLVPPKDVPGGDVICVCQDPQGGVFAVHQVKAPA